MAKTTTTPAAEKPPTLAKVMDEAAVQGVAAFAASFNRFRNAPPPIISKRAAFAVTTSIHEMVNTLRAAAIGEANNGKVDVSRVDVEACKAIEDAVKAFDSKGVPEPFRQFVDEKFLQSAVVSILGASLVCWNNQLQKPEPKPATL